MTHVKRKSQFPRFLGASLSQQALRHRGSVSPNGSSETTREAPFFQFQFYMCPEHKKLDPSFLEWFIGFTEGDGCFLVRHDGKKPRLGFEIFQKDPALMHLIRTTLGYGRVYCTQSIYWKFSVSDKHGLQRLHSLFSGNLVLPKRILQFQQWCAVGEGLGFWPSTYDVPPRLTPFGGLMTTAWFSGFAEAEGCFHAHVRAFTEDSLTIDRLFHVTQQDLAGERQVLECIGKFFASSARVRLAKAPNVFRLTMKSSQSLALVSTYFTTFPLRGKKKRAFLRWQRASFTILSLRQLKKKENSPYSEKSIQKLIRLCKSINSQTLEHLQERKALSSFSEEEETKKEKKG